MHWLEKFTDPEEASRYSELIVGDAPSFGPWTAGTDARTLVVVRGHLPGPHQTGGNVSPAVKTICELLGQPAPADATTVSRAALLAFAGPAEEAREGECERCNGTGSIEHICGCDLCEADEEDCPECEGTKLTVAYPKSRPGRVLGLLVDRVRLAALMAFAPEAPEYRVWGQGKLVRVDASLLWTAAIASISPGESSKDVPELVGDAP